MHYQKQELYKRRRGQNILRMQEGAPPNTEPSGMDEPLNQLGGEGDAERRDRNGRTGMNAQRSLGVCFCFAMIPDTDKPRDVISQPAFRPRPNRHRRRESAPAN
jgi:hypothetical protein